MSFIERILKIKRLISFELVSSRNAGIRYLVRIPREDSSVLKRTLLAYSPDTEVNETNDYAPITSEGVLLKELRQSHAYIYPLQIQTVLQEHDPIAYFTNHMTKLQPDELVTLQIVVTPVAPSTHFQISERIAKLKLMIADNKDISRNISGNLFSYLFDAITGVRPKKINELSKSKQLLYTTVESKINQPLFETSIRVLVSPGKGSPARMHGLLSSFETFTNSWQSIKPKRAILSSKVINSLRYFFYKNRLLSTGSGPILSVAELSSIYHFPYASTTKTEDIVKTRSSQLPIPLRFKNTRISHDIVFAHNTYGGLNTPIGMTLDERRRHMYIIGATGTGKTTLLLKMIYEDIKNGKGIAILDPHGDLAERLIGIIPPERVKDVVYFNPHDINTPIGLNILETSPNLTPAEESLEKDLITSGLISVFHKLYPPRYSGPRMEHILRNTVLTALEGSNPTLQTVYRLLTNVSYRKQEVEKLTDPILKDFWKDEFEKQGSYQKAELISPITNKLGRFLTTSMTRNILTQEKSKLNFEDIMNSKKILICDLSKGKIGEDTSAFLGSLITVKLQLAALKRVHIPEEKRSDFFLYIDEFQNFATMAFAQIMSEARKYRLSAILAHQTTSQIEEKDLLKIILANVGTVISFRTNNPSDEAIMLPLFSPEVEKNEISSLPSYTFYAKMNAIVPQETFTGTSDNFSIPDDPDSRGLLIEYSQKTYGMEVTHKTDSIKEKPFEKRQIVVNQKIHKVQLKRKSI